jgi:hypothetical protein
MQNFIIKKNMMLDNVEFFKQNSEQGYVDCIQNLIVSKPFGDHKFYIFSFVKRIDDDAGIKKMYHQARLTRPEPVPGTTLMKVDPKDPDKAVIIWTLPNQENFGLYKQDKMFADPFVHECIERFKANPMDMCKPDPDDLSDDQIRDVYRSKK